MYGPQFLVGKHDYGHAYTATFNQSGNATVDASTVPLELGTGRTGIYNMSGGTLKLGRWGDGASITGAGADDAFNFSGGTIIMSGNQLPWSSGKAWFNIIGPNAGSYTEIFSGGFTTLQILEPTVQITQPGGSTHVTEGGTTDTYEVVLTGTPTDNVTITARPDSNDIDLGSGYGTTITLTFTTSNWNIPQTVTVTANDD